MRFYSALALPVVLAASAAADPNVFTVSTGVMLEARDVDPAHLARRSALPDAPLVHRSIAQESVELSFDPRGLPVFPDAPASLLARSSRAVVEQAHRLRRRWNHTPTKWGGQPKKSHHSSGGDDEQSAPKKHTHTQTQKAQTKTSSGNDHEETTSKEKSLPGKIGDIVGGIVSSFTAQITWYTGQDLKNPSCLPGGGWNPTDESYIAALTIDWPGKPKCGDFLRLSSNGKETVVRVMDSCAGCASGSKHVDLTRAAFSELYAFSVGLANDIKCEILKNPPSDSDDESKYGPASLN